MENFKLTITHDEYPENPRVEFCNLSNLILFHKRYRLGDKHNINSSDYNSFEEVKKAIKKKYNVYVIFPVYMYEHGNIALSLDEFSCPFDSGQIGFAIVTKEDFKKNYNLKIAYRSEKYLDSIISNIKAELADYQAYLNGEVYRFVIEDENGDLVESCSGFYNYSECEKTGNDILKNLS